MNTLDWILIAAVAASFAFALFKTIDNKRKGKCCGTSCSGNCAACNAACKQKKS